MVNTQLQSSVHVCEIGLCLNYLAQQIEIKHKSMMNISKTHIDFKPCTAKYFGHGLTITIVSCDDR